MQSTAALLGRAADHLTLAADLAEPTDPAFAGQIRLAAATLPGVAGDSNVVLVSAQHDPPATFASPADVPELLERALNCLDRIPPLAGPADLQLCAWHLHELRRIAASGTAS